MLVQSCSISVTVGEGFRWLPSTSSNQDLWVRRINWRTLNQIALRAILFYVTRWRVLVCDLVTSNRMIIERKVSMVSTNNNRRLHLKMQARGVKHDRTLCVLRQRKGKGVTMVSTNNNKKSFWKQVRRSDQLRYPIHNRSFVAHGRLWMPCAPAAKTCFEHLHASVKSYVFSNVAILNLYVFLNIACWLWVLETDIDTHTHTHTGIWDCSLR